MHQARPIRLQPYLKGIEGAFGIVPVVTLTTPGTADSVLPTPIQPRSSARVAVTAEAGSYAEDPDVGHPVAPVAAVGVVLVRRQQRH